VGIVKFPFSLECPWDRGKFRTILKKFYFKQNLRNHHNQISSKNVREEEKSELIPF
jgi:hypothetical protein